MRIAVRGFTLLELLVVVAIIGLLVGTLCGEIAATALAEVAGRTRPANAELLELARVMAM